MANKIFVKVKERMDPSKHWVCYPSEDTADQLVVSTLSTNVNESLNMMGIESIDKAFVYAVPTIMSEEVALNLIEDSNLFNEVPVSVKERIKISMDMETWGKISDKTFLSQSGIVLLVGSNMDLVALAKSEKKDITCVATIIKF